MIQLAEDALCLLDHLDVERAFVLVLSMGGMIAQELVLLAPERILALFLGCTHCGGSLRVPPAPDTLRLLAANAGLSQKEIVEKNLPIFFSQACRKEDPEATAAYCAAQLSSPVQPEYAFLAQLAAIQDFDSTERIGQINVPTMIVTGSEDILVPPENAQILAKLIHNAEMAVIPGAGHALHAECPETLNSLADGFFRHCLPGGLHRGSG
jgi:pimeloyl-ACP methyl ester carboxylesterase